MWFSHQSFSGDIRPPLVSATCFVYLNFTDSLPLYRWSGLGLVPRLCIQYSFIYLHLLNQKQNATNITRYHAGSRVDGPPQVTVAPSFLIILLQKSSGPLQVPISSPLLSCTVPSQISRLSHLRPDFISTYCGVNVHLSQWQCLKCENDSRHFQPGEGPSRGLLRDCKTSRNLRFKL